MASTSEAVGGVDKVALVDLDGTMIDGDYQITDARIHPAIAAAQASGWQVGPSSDTPYEALCVWRERLGMNGPVVAEKGAVVEIDGRPEADLEVVQAFAEARASTAGRFADMGLPVWSGNPVEALRSGLTVGAVDERVILLNSLSQASLRFFVRRVNAAGELQIDHDATRELAAQVQELYPEFADIQEEINPRFGLVIVSLARYTKRSGTQRLMAARGWRRLVMIGNSMSDYIGSDIAIHGAVADADPEYLARCGNYVATGPEGRTTGGVVQLLARLGELRA